MSNIKVLSIKKYGKGYKVGKYTTLGELQCKDGTDIVRYCPETINNVEKLRELTGSSAVIYVSAYRTLLWNRKVGGASRSTHIDGYAVDVYFKNSKYSTKQIACMAQDLGFKGIGYMNSQTIHLDMANRIYRGDERKGYTNNVGNDFYKYFGIARGSLPTNAKKGYTGGFPNLPTRGYFTYNVKTGKISDRGAEVVKLQKFLNWAIGTNLSLDGDYGRNTYKAVQRFQNTVHTVADGYFGKSTLKFAKTFTK